MGDSENNKRILENISMFGLGDLSEESRKELEYGLEHKLFTRIDVGAAQIKYMASEFWDMYNESTLAEKIGIAACLTAIVLSTIAYNVMVYEPERPVLEKPAKTYMQPVKPTEKKKEIPHNPPKKNNPVTVSRTDYEKKDPGADKNPEKNYVKPEIPEEAKTNDVASADEMFSIPPFRMARKL